MTPTTSTPVVDELATPFDDLESPTTVATPSCCCCCCCCIVTVGATAIAAARTVSNDLSESDGGVEGEERPTRLVALGAVLPIAAVILGIIGVVNTPSDNGGDGPVGLVFLLGLLAGAAVFVMVRVRAGRSPAEASVRTLMALVVIAAAVMAEFVLVLMTVGIFWIGAPLWWWLFWRASQRREPAA